tara:strand:- start:1848 stop:2072 length:225 start_codon:yes stop_codon:yes gene_type:complete
MFNKLKFISSNIIINISLFSLLMIGIQNSYQRKKVNFIFFETINLPISFITGTSFIAGSISGAFIALKLKEEEK